VIFVWEELAVFGFVTGSMSKQVGEPLG